MENIECAKLDKIPSIDEEKCNDSYLKIPTTYKKGGSSGIEGSLYEVRLLTLILFKGTNKGYSFRLATNMKVAGKFDDIIVEFFNEKLKIKTSLFIQTKHRLNQSEKISLHNLITEKDEDFSLVKYFYSFQELKEKNLIDKETKLIIFTNIDVDRKVKELTTCCTWEENDILSIKYLTKKNSVMFNKYYLFKYEIVNELMEKIQNYKPTKISSKLIDIILNGHPINLSNKTILNDFIPVLTEKVLEITDESIFKEFRINFLKNSPDLDPESKKFRIIIENEICKRSYRFKRVIEEEFAKLNHANEKYNTFYEYFEAIVQTDDYEFSLKDLNEYVKFKNLHIISYKHNNITENCWPLVPKNEIIDFIQNHLVLAANQCSEEQLEEILEGELRTLNIFAPDYFQAKILQWYKEKLKNNLGRVLSNEEGRQFINEIELKVQSFIYCEKLSEYGIQFHETVLNDLKNSLEQTFILISAQDSTLSLIKLYQALNDRLMEYVFFNSEKFLLSHKQIFSFINANCYKGIVIDCNARDMEKTFKILNKERHHNLMKKFIIVCEQYNGTPTMDSCKIVNDIFHFVNLSVESQIKILEKKVKLQGKILNLNELFQINTCHEIHEATLVQLIKCPNIAIGNELDYFEVCEKEYFIDPCIDSRIIIRRNIFDDENIEDIFAISNMSEQDIIEFEEFSNGKTVKYNNSAFLNNSQFIILEHDKVDNQFDSLSKKFTKNVHLLTYHHWEYIWQKSTGSISNLSKYRKQPGSSFSSVPEMLNQCNGNKIIIISAAAGMGKTTVLSDIAIKTKDAYSYLWVVKINLIEHTDILHKKINSPLQNTDDAVQLLNDILTSKTFYCDQDMDQNLFTLCLKHTGNVQLFFDGFDEISPSYETIILDLIYLLSKTNISKIWITTRPNMKEVLESKFNTFTFTLIPFSLKKQTDFLNKYWKYNLKNITSDVGKIEKKINVYSNAILKLISQSIMSKEKQFSGFPLILKMAAEYFQSNNTPVDWEGCQEYISSSCEDRLPKLMDKLDLVDLYQGFIQKKISFWGKQKLGLDFTKPGATIQFEYFLPEVYNNYKILALCTLLNSTTFNDFFPEINIDELIKRIFHLHIENIGIIDNIVNKKPKFIHKTLAEYLGALYIFEELTINNRVAFLSLIVKSKIFTHTDFETLRLFLNSLLSNRTYNLSYNCLEGIKEEILIDDQALVFHAAVKEGNLEIFKLLLNGVESFCDLDKIFNLYDITGQTILHVAVLYEQYQILEWLVNEKKINLNAREKVSKNTVLHIAAQKGLTRIVKYLIDNGADINLQDVRLKPSRTRRLILKENAFLETALNCTPLHRAVEFEYFDIVKYLTEKGANIEIKNINGLTALHLAIKHCKFEIAHYLIENGADVDSQEENGLTPLCTALIFIQDKGLKFIELLFNKGANANIIDNNDSSPMHIAVRYNKFKELKYLNNKVADINKKNLVGLTPLHLAVKYCRIQMFDFLIEEEGADINSQDEDGFTPLHTSLYLKKNFGLYIIKYLVSKGANVNLGNKNHVQPLHTAIKYGKINEFKWLVENGADINAKNGNGLTPLHIAVTFYKLQMVHDLLQRNINVNCQDNDGLTPLHLVLLFSYRNGLKLIDCLVKKGANIHIKNKSNRTPLHLAADKLKFEELKYLLDKGADVDVRDSQGLTPAHIAMKQGNLKIVQYLTNHGANLNIQDKNGMIPLHFAIKHCKLEETKHPIQENISNKDIRNQQIKFSFEKNELFQEMILYLIEKKSDINIQDSKGSTALHLAVETCTLKVIQCLCEKGANLNIQNDNYFTPIDIAMMKNRPEIEQFLTERKPIPNKLLKTQSKYFLKIMYKIFSFVQYLKRIKINIKNKLIGQKWTFFIVFILLLYLCYFMTLYVYTRVAT